MSCRWHLLGWSPLGHKIILCRLNKDRFFLKVLSLLIDVCKINIILCWSYRLPVKARHPCKFLTQTIGLLWQANSSLAVDDCEVVTKLIATVDLSWVQSHGPYAVSQWGLGTTIFQVGSGYSRLSMAESLWGLNWLMTEETSSSSEICFCHSKDKWPIFFFFFFEQKPNSVEHLEGWSMGDKWSIGREVEHWEPGGSIEREVEHWGEWSIGKRSIGRGGG